MLLNFADSRNALIPALMALKSGGCRRFLSNSLSITTHSSVIGCNRRSGVSKPILHKEY